jgi:hypothetical protein
MGYRSEVAIAISNKHLTDEIKENLSDACEITDKGGHTLFCYSYCKWYESDPSVEFVMSFLGDLELEPSTPDDAPFGYIRIGESLEDIDIRGYPYEFGMGVSRTINFEDDIRNEEHE